MSTQTSRVASPQASTAGVPLLFPGVVGFYVVFRVCLTFLFFQSDPVLGTVVNIAIGLTLLFGAVLYSAEDRPRARGALLQSPPVHWILTLLAFSLVSALWTGTQSIAAALAYWAEMTAEVVIVLLLLRRRDTVRFAEGIMRGAVWGAAALSIVAWCSPSTADLRLGNDAFLHPNTLGMEIAIGALIAQYLAPRDARWRWLGIALAITLLRTLSKTAIVAFVIAESWYLMQNKAMTHWAKLRIGAAASIVIATFWGLLASYIDAYNNAGSGNQAETLTGRTALWAVAFSMSLEKPWFGHGLYSFKSLIPSFGNFEPVHAHNELLQQFFEYGVAGVAIVVAVYWSFYWLARRAPAGELRTLSLVLLIFALLHGIADTLPFNLSFPLWLLTALSLCLSGSFASEAAAS